MGKWKLIRVSEEVYNKLSELKNDRPFTAVIEELIEKAQAKDKLDPIAFDKAAWYSFKLVTTVTFLKAYKQLGLEDKVKEQLDMVRYVTEQIKERYEVETKEVFEVAKQYAESGSKDDMILLNEITKAIIKYLFMKIANLKVQA